MKTSTLNLNLLFSIFLLTLIATGCTGHAPDSENQSTKENYIIKGDKVYFNEAETKLVNGKRISYTDFPYEEPDKKDKSNHNAWVESYKSYHMNIIAGRRINYFINNEGLHATKLSKYEFIIKGYYADFSYQVVPDENRSVGIYGTPIEWHER